MRVSGDQPLLDKRRFSLFLRKTLIRFLKDGAASFQISVFLVISDYNLGVWPDLRFNEFVVDLYML